MPLPLLIPLIGAGVQAIGSGVQLFQGIHDRNVARREQQTLDATRPMYEIPQNYYDNVSLAESRAQRGYSDSTLSYFNNQLERGMQANNSAILRGGGSLNYINSAYDNFVQGTRSIASDDEKYKMANVTQLINSRIELAKEQSQKWAMNVWSKWQDKAVANAQRMNVGVKEMNAGLNGLVSAGGNFANILSAPKIPTQGGTQQAQTQQTFEMVGNSADYINTPTNPLGTQNAMNVNPQNSFGYSPFKI